MRAFVKAILRVFLGGLPAPAHHAHRGPGLHLRWRLGWLRGVLWRPWWYFLGILGGPKVSIGKRFSLQGALRVRGPGHIFLGDDIIVDARTDIYTHSLNARVDIGAGTFLNGTRFGIQQAVSIGEDCIIADARIMDTDFHSLQRNRHDKSALVAVAPVSIGKNVWVAAGAAILKGVSIGDNSVVAFGAIVTKSISADRIAGGNPAKEIGEVPR